MSNSTAVAATIGVSALGVLAYYGYQNLNGTEEDIKVGQLYNGVDEDNSTEESSNFQEEAKKEVEKAVTNARNAWGSFWKGEYASIDDKTKNVKVTLAENDEACTADRVKEE